MNALPGAQEAAVAVPLPLSDSYINLAFAIEGRPPRTKSDAPTADFVAISPNYFHVMQVPLLRGREFSDADSESGPKVCVISSSLAQQLFPNRERSGPANHYWLSDGCDAGDRRHRGRRKGQ